jgi:hypothetical protein
VSGGWSGIPGCTGSDGPRGSGGEDAIAVDHCFYFLQLKKRRLGQSLSFLVAGCWLNKFTAGHGLDLPSRGLGLGSELGAQSRCQ